MTLPENELNHPVPALHGRHHQASSPFRVLQLAIQALLLQQQIHLLGFYEQVKLVNHVNQVERILQVAIQALLFQ